MRIIKLKVKIIPFKFQFTSLEEKRGTANKGMEMEVMNINKSKVITTNYEIKSNREKTIKFTWNTKEWLLQRFETH